MDARRSDRSCFNPDCVKMLERTVPQPPARVGVSLDIEANRAASKYTRGEMARRIAWMFGHALFRLTPRTFFGVRRAILRAFGARIGAHVNIYSTATIYMPWHLDVGDWTAIGEYAYIYNLGQISIADHVTISQRAHLCAGTHDYTRADMPLLKPPIRVSSFAWICADAFVGPGIAIGEGAVVGARAVVIHDVEPWAVVAGNPARTIKRRVINNS
jgi:putative colanic acid biosynthesis acetyltransferase WcaF